ncbi:hypothetical protein [Streptomyces sp. KL110A]|uniref:hypothetical protein n=1 Tax=Streptomyces sp. KL110A TaxID=3384221 RepID=UPI0038CB5B18
MKPRSRAGAGRHEGGPAPLDARNGPAPLDARSVADQLDAVLAGGLPARAGGDRD